MERGNVLTEEGQARRDRLLTSTALDLGVNMVDTYENEGQWEHVAACHQTAQAIDARLNLPAVPDVCRRKYRPCG